MNTKELTIVDNKEILHKLGEDENSAITIEYSINFIDYKLYPDLRIKRHSLN